MKRTPSLLVVWFFIFFGEVWEGEVKVSVDEKLYEQKKKWHTDALVNYCYRTNYAEM